MPDMHTIRRDPDSTAGRHYDLIIIGGGIYGVMLAHEATRMGKCALLVEKDDFGGATTFNSLRILHGGFRYLQTMDIKRFYESVSERSWFLKTFPNLTQPLPCLMPLYGEGLRRPGILKIAGRLNDLLSCRRNNGLSAENQLLNTRVISAAKTRQICPQIRNRDLRGGVVWYDAIMTDSQRIVIQALKWACNRGATALNYMKALELDICSGKVQGLLCQDRVSRKQYEIQCDVIVNAAGPWSRKVARNFHKDYPELFRPSMAWNVLFKRPWSSHALAVSAPVKGARTYFIVPWKGRLLAGTGHAPRLDHASRPEITAAELNHFIKELNRACPELGLRQDDIGHVFTGLLPVRRTGDVKLTNRAVIIDHASCGGPNGLYSVSGVKFTTARRVAEEALRRIFNHPDFHKVGAAKNDDSDNSQTQFAASGPGKTTEPDFLERLRTIIASESVVYSDDLFYRRTDLWENPDTCEALGKLLFP
jgi:glycerol-3-phosphate dehydrogenase